MLKLKGTERVWGTYAVEAIGPANVRGGAELLAGEEVVNVLAHQCVGVQEYAPVVTPNADG